MPDTITESEEPGYTPTTEQVRSGYALDVPDYTNAWEDESRREAFDRWLAKVRAEARAEALRDAYAAAERQTQLASLVAGRPTDFEKAVMSCMAAIQALSAEGEQS